MILKEADNKDTVVAALEALLPHSDARQQKSIQRELACVRAGIKGENESAYLLDFEFRNSRNTLLVHDLRIEHNGRVAQIDHLLLNRWLEFYILETKHFADGLKVDEQGQFLRWNSYRKTYEGMPSPIEQAERHGAVLTDLISSLDWSTRAGLRLTPTLKHRVLISPGARLMLPAAKPELADVVLKADTFAKHWKAEIDKESFFSTVASVARIVSRDTLQEMARKLVACHKPMEFNYAARFGVEVAGPPGQSNGAAITAPSPVAGHCCRHCKSVDLEMFWGKYGYYFKCRACARNTPAPPGCERKDCTSRIRKAGNQFTQYCEACGWEKPLHQNHAS